MFFESLLEKFEQSTVGAYAIPLVYACGGVFLIIVVTGLFMRFLRRHISRAVANASSSEASTTHSTLNRLLHNDGDLLLKLLVWIRWVSVALVIAMSLGMLFSALSELMMQSLKLKSTAVVLQQADVKLDSWVRTFAKAFWSLIFLFFAARLIENALHALISRSVVQHNESRALARVQTLNLMTSYAVRVVMFVVVVLTILPIFGFNIAPLLATAGVASVAIGFGAQSLVKDVLAGFFILLEDQFAVGDTISIDDKTGKVESMTLRITRLRAVDGQLIVIPNSEIKTVRNTTTGWLQFEFQVGVAYDTNSEQALAVLTDELTRLQNEKQRIMFPMPEVPGVSKLADSAVVLRAFVRALPDKKWEIERELNRRVLERFKKEKIEIAYPQFDVNIKTPLSGVSANA